jgi:CRP-like cAMP-binding protein
MSEERRGIVPMSIDERVDAISTLAFFEGLSREELVPIAARAHVLAFAPGDVIVPEGEAGLGFYVIIVGRAGVWRDGTLLTTLGDGDFFGEVSLLEWAPRNATVTAESDVRCLGILRSFFKDLLSQHPRLAMRVLEAEQARKAADDD